MKRILLFATVLFSAVSFAQPSVSCDSVLQLGTCAGSQVIVPFSVSGGNFSFGNQFRAQLSDQWGNWGNPVQIGQMTWFTSGIIFATLPQNVTFGFLYRVRVIATNPIDTSNDSPNTILVTQSAFLNSIQALPNDTACWGDTLSLGVLMPGSTYAWSTGDTTQFINITGPGQYTCTTTDFLNCTSQDTINIVYEICSSGMNELVNGGNFILYPSPASSLLYLGWDPGQSAKGMIEITDLAGRIMFTTQVSTGTTAIDISGMVPGMYLATLRSGEGGFTRRILVE